MPGLPPCPECYEDGTSFPDYAEQGDHYLCGNEECDCHIFEAFRDGCSVREWVSATEGERVHHDRRYLRMNHHEKGFVSEELSEVRS